MNPHTGSLHAPPELASSPAVWIDPANRDAHFLALLARSAHAADPSFSVITTRRGEVDFGSVVVHPFYPRIASLPVGPVALRTRIEMLARYPRAFRDAGESLATGTSVLYSSELPFGLLERSALLRLKPRVRKLTRLVHNVDRTSRMSELFDEHLFLSQSERLRAVDVLHIPLASSHVLSMPHFGTVMASIVPDQNVAAAIASGAGSRLILAYISRADHAHGLDLFYQVLAVARSLSLPICGVVIGRADRGWTERADATVRSQLDLGDGIAWSYLGPYSSEALKAVTNSADAVIAPYRTISQSAAIALALGEKVPVFASRVGGNEEIIRDGLDGTFFDPNDPASIGDLLTSIYQGGSCAREHFAEGPIGEHLEPSIVASTLISRLRT